MNTSLRSTGRASPIRIAMRGFAIWPLIMAAEIIHGIARRIILVPHFGEFRSHQIGILTGAIIVLFIACVSVRWNSECGTGELLMVGLMWVALTLAFEFLVGRLVMGLSWQRLLADYNLPEGGLMPLGMILLGLSPLIAAKARGIRVA